MIKNQAIRYLQHYFFAVLFLSFGLAYFNWLIDPYQVFGHHIWNPKTTSSVIGKHMRAFKAKEVERVKPQTIIIGSSRSDIGIDPMDPAFKYQPAYNLSIAGARIYELRHYLYHAHAIKPLRQIILGLDFFSFLGYRGRSTPDFDKHRLAHINSIPFFRHYRDWRDSLFSLDALQDSWDTYFSVINSSCYPVFIYGMNNAAHKKCDVKKKGHRFMFEYNENDYLTNKYINFSFSYPDNKSSTINDFRKLVKFCLDNNIDLVLFISPIHARQLEIINKAGLWNNFENWKENLVSVVENEVEHKKGKKINIWDFSDCSALTTEEVPIEGDTKTQMQWFWESSHYKSSLGHIVITKLLGDQKNYHSNNTFGTILNSKTLNEHFQLIRERQFQYRYKKTLSKSLRQQPK